MSTIKSSTTTTTAYQVVADTTGALVIQTGATPTTAVTVSSAQVVTLANALPVASGGTGSTSTTFVNLASNVTGTLPIANGGTGQTTAALAGSALGAIGVGQTWTSFTSGTRVSGTTYTNSTGRPILVQVRGSGAGTCGLTINSISVSSGNTSASQGITATGIVPNGGTYAGTYVTFGAWVELR